MTGKPTNPFEAFQIPQNLFAAPQNFMPSGKAFEQLNQMARNLAEAQVAYGQALMRANTVFLSALFAQAAPAEAERPSEAARKTDERAA
ncbi:hypothetical protein GCM10010909_13280 [Acidocella aquatica]|uniref:Phasin protein n=1 Tax=Acidocella aquatica TaxID=1922313 RepID=A0ABQ6A8W5_9PROT|nr:hypothetical protein [Acidocella aquatica]GLR66648.1 hypothetical protein GCM10010909_13280 [Acidocella aquatica]